MLWDDFLNSDYHDWRGGGKSEDRLDKPAWRTRWLVEHKLPDPGPPTKEELEALKRLRGELLLLVRQLIAGRPAESGDLERLNQILAEGPVTRRIAKTGSGLRMESVPVRSDWPGIQAEIAASFCRMLAEGEPTRLRICDNPDCLWVYYDDTRNRSKRFCDDKMCGNLMKVRRFRARRKASHPADTGRPGGHSSSDAE
ncbi:hypothetical protein GE107_13415 [Cohnella sp. CFH 77786]|uniref:CGNR zinc finger domain-containing protein n=1 Tax=Cohnella sp. CFH 77786 TaxID=2662265 RepID=UPI001C60FC13|nr:ABATE domain-containing protein [Cohnella sp. CFH 77786]MBW5447062.1 hypothetical protein [Cohnella sp. CFH 77786]